MSDDLVINACTTSDKITIVYPWHAPPPSPGSKLSPGRLARRRRRDETRRMRREDARFAEQQEALSRICFQVRGDP